MEVYNELESSIDGLKESRSIKVGEFILEGLKNGRIRVDGYILYNNVNEIPKSTLKDELKAVKEKFALVMNETQTFKEFAIQTGIDYYVVLDVGNAGITICGEIEGEYKLFI